MHRYRLILLSSTLKNWNSFFLGGDAYLVAGPYGCLKTVTEFWEEFTMCMCYSVLSLPAGTLPS